MAIHISTQHSMTSAPLQFNHTLCDKNADSAREGHTIRSDDEDEAFIQALAELPHDDQDDGIVTPDDKEDDDDGIFTPSLPSQQSWSRITRKPIDFGHKDEEDRPTHSPSSETISPRKKRKVQWADEDQLIEPSPPASRTSGGIAGSTAASSTADEDVDHAVDIDADPDHGSQIAAKLKQSNHGDNANHDSKGKEKDYLESEIYNPIAYGDVRSYMKFKRAKLKVQESALLQEEAELMRVGDAAEAALNGRDGVQQEGAAAPSDGRKSDIFRGCCVYINGQTHPPCSELRRLLVLHGGQHMPYLDQKRPCTHIVALNLTPKKRIEFKDYKVVLPGWILESIETGKRADWRKWKCDAITGSNGHVGGNLSVGGDRELGMTGWRDLAKQAQNGKALPRFGEAVESPWGRPSNQKTLLQGFIKVKEEKKASPSLSPPSLKDVAMIEQQRQEDKAGLQDKLDSRSSPAAQASPAQPKVEVAPARKVKFVDVVEMWDDNQTARPIFPQQAKEASLGRTERGDRAVGDTASYTRSPQKAHTTLPTHREVAAPPTAPAGTTPTEQEEPAELSAAPETPCRPRPADKVDDSIGIIPQMTASAPTVGDMTVKSGYASRPSNTHAARLLASPSWRERNTATSKGFLAGYFAKSRLHHLSTWKTSLQDMVSSALREAGRQPGSLDLPKGVARVIMHIDFDSFFVSVGLRKRPDLKETPVAVCHGSGTGLPPAAEGLERRPADDQSSSTSEIASCNYVARGFGVRNGMSLGQAKKLCPRIQTIPYDFKTYSDISLAFYTFLLEHADALQAVSVDETLVDVSMLLENMRNGLYPSGSLYQRYSDRISSQRYEAASVGGSGDGGGGGGTKWSKQLAEAFRDEIRDLCGCEASIGIGSNILLARLATRKAKPGGSFHLTEEMRQPFLDALDVDDLHGIGWSLRERLRELFKTINVGEIRLATSEKRVVHELGPKKGKVIWEKMHGKDADRLEGNKLRQSVGSHVNYGIRFLTNEEAETFVDGMCREVSQRAQAVRLKGRQVSVQVMVRAKEAPHEAPKFLGHGVCDTHHRSTQVSGPAGCAIDDSVRIKQAAWPLIRDLRADPKELRGIAISLNKLELADGKGGNIATPKPSNGQSVLRFSKVASPDKAATAAVAGKRSSGSPIQGAETDDEADVSSRGQEDEEGGDGLPDLQKGPLAATPRRPVVAKRAINGSIAGPDLKSEAEAEIETPSLTPRFPASTQLAIPSASQLDPTVIAALPTPFREQIHAALGRCLGTERVDFLPTQPTPDRPPPPSSSSSSSQLQHTPRILPRSTPTTPQKAKVAPSPAVAEALLLPSTSQIDASVLAELPESIRRDILRQSRLGRYVSASSSGSSSPAGPSTPTRRKQTLTDSTLPFLPLGLANGNGNGNALDPDSDIAAKKRKSSLFRSLSESPRKRTKTKLRDTIGVGDRLNIEAAAPVDPASISSDELKVLGIDEDVFRALPAEMQREMYLYHRDKRASELKRFKAGSNRGGWEEVTLAERRETRRASEVQNEADKKAAAMATGGVRQATLHGGGAAFVARPSTRTVAEETIILPLDDDRPAREAPNLRGVTDLDALRPLLTAWYRAFASQGPRKGDVQRIATFLLACLDPEAPISSATWDLEKVRACLVSLRSVIVEELGGEDRDVGKRARKCVARRRRRRDAETEEAGEDEGSVEMKWWIAFYDILAGVNERVKAKMGGAVLSLD